MPSDGVRRKHGVYNSVCGGRVGHEQAEERQQEGPLLLLCLPGGRGHLTNPRG